MAGSLAGELGLSGHDRRAPAGSSLSPSCFYETLRRSKGEEERELRQGYAVRVQNQSIPRQGSGSREKAEQATRDCCVLKKVFKKSF